ncbi:MAG: hypothetical protein AAF517_17670 [Planctomycetota bacterium]
MDSQQVFLTQFVLSLFVFGLLARWYLAPRLAGLATQQALVPLVIPHMFRYIGLSFVVPQLAGTTLRTDFATAAAYGDLASAFLAFFTIVALRGGWRAAIPLAWLFNIVGVVDLGNALRQVDVVPQFGVVWFIPTFIVPVLLVTHFMALTWLLRHAVRTESTNLVPEVASTRSQATVTR